MKWERKERKKFLLSLIPSQVGVFPARNRKEIRIHSIVVAQQKNGLFRSQKKLDLPWSTR